MEKTEGDSDDRYFIDDETIYYGFDPTPVFNKAGSGRELFFGSKTSGRMPLEKALSGDSMVVIEGATRLLAEAFVPGADKCETISDIGRAIDLYIIKQPYVMQYFQRTVLTKDKLSELTNRKERTWNKSSLAFEHGGALVFFAARASVTGLVARFEDAFAYLDFNELPLNRLSELQASEFLLRLSRVLIPAWTRNFQPNIPPDTGLVQGVHVMKTDTSEDGVHSTTIDADSTNSTIIGKDMTIRIRCHPEQTFHISCLYPEATIRVAKSDLPGTWLDPISITGLKSSRLDDPRSITERFFGDCGLNAPKSYQLIHHDSCILFVPKSRHGNNHVRVLFNSLFGEIQSEIAYKNVFTLPNVYGVFYQVTPMADFRSWRRSVMYNAPRLALFTPTAKPTAPTMADQVVLSGLCYAVRHSPHCAAIVRLVVASGRSFKLLYRSIFARDPTSQTMIPDLLRLLEKVFAVSIVDKETYLSVDTIVETAYCTLFAHKTDLKDRINCTLILTHLCRMLFMVNVRNYTITNDLFVAITPRARFPPYAFYVHDIKLGIDYGRRFGLIQKAEERCAWLLRKVVAPPINYVLFASS